MEIDGQRAAHGSVTLPVPLLTLLFQFSRLYYIYLFIILMELSSVVYNVNYAKYYNLQVDFTMAFCFFCYLRA